MNREARLRLAWCGLHPDRLRQLREQRGPDTAVLRDIGAGRIDVSPRIRAAAETAPEAIATMLQETGADAVFKGDTAYPDHLAVLPDAPDVLFVKGTLPPSPGVAVVGTRRCTAYGRGLARAYGRAIAAAGWPLVSGLARGIDGEAHRGTVAGEGVGVAVLGSGIDVWYPSEHRSLGESLLAAGGAVLSEYPPGSPPEAWRFPPRNRIISGLAGAVIVAEAGETGGALITAARAVDHGRAVLAVPGDIDRRTSRGTNLLIRDGAIPVFEPDDLLEALSLILGPPPDPGPVLGSEDDLAALIGPVGIPFEDLVAASDLPAAEVVAGIGRLEANGVVEQRAGLWHLR